MDNFDPLQIISLIFIGFVPFLFSLCFHEMAHAWMAKKKGDRTAEMLGRLSMNPFVHADPVGTFMLPLSSIIFGIPLFFGWAKPVPVNERNLSRPKEYMFWIALAGPVSNLILATIAALICAGAIVFGGQGTSPRGMSIAGFAFGMVVINMMLAIFNMIPLHPLDGGKVIARFLPYSANRFLEENATALNIGLIVLFVLGGFRFLGQYIMSSADFLVTILEFSLRTIF